LSEDELDILLLLGDPSFTIGLCVITTTVLNTASVFVVKNYVQQTTRFVLDMNHTKFQVSLICAYTSEPPLLLAK
jgi:hypothetical protein